jgi:mono/diheme cytochrome c family protein
MKKFGKGLLYAVITIILIAVIALSYITLVLPDVGEPEDIKIAVTPQRVARGEYLANHVTVCTDCHSQRDWSKFAGPLKTGLGVGGELFDARAGFPGRVYSPNITPYNLKDWTDGEIFRAITTGVRKNGVAIFPLMPWPYYSKMSREDLYCIIAYIRTLKPVVADYPGSKLNFPLNMIVHTMPQKATLGTLPSPSDTLKYGEYLVQSAACRECHSQDKNGKPVPGMEFAGGREYGMKGNTLRSSNITPDKETGIGNWTEAAFLQRFKAFNDTAKIARVADTEFQTIMPWYAYAGMKDADLKAIYAYLRTIKPVNNKVVRFRVNNGTK